MCDVVFPIPLSLYARFRIRPICQRDGRKNCHIMQCSSLNPEECLTLRKDYNHQINITFLALFKLQTLRLFFWIDFYNY